MNIDYFIPAIGNQDLLDNCLAELVAGFCYPETRLVVIDNGSKTPLETTFAEVIRNEENIGMVRTLRQAMDHSKSEILIYAHSDFNMYEDLWDSKIISRFYEDQKLGLIGAVGAEQADKNGGRSNVWCSFRDGEVHGWKPETSSMKPVVLLDGCFMAFRRCAMEKAGIPELPFARHHYHDKHWSMQMVVADYRVGVLQMDCEHLGGQTSTRPECQESFQTDGGEQAIYDSAERQYLERFLPILPVSVDANWNYSKRLHL